MKSKFLNISIGVTLMLFGAGFLIRSITVAHAAPTPENFVAEGTNNIGKYMFQMYTISHPTEGNIRYGLVWDTETGKSLGYREGRVGWVSETIFPEKPLGE